MALSEKVKNDPISQLKRSRAARIAGQKRRKAYPFTFSGQKVSDSTKGKQ
jgi:hypothetical protein